MTNHDIWFNPTIAAATANEGHVWPGSCPTSAGRLPGPNAEAAAAVNLGGQAPMFIHADVVDMGLVRLGGQSPLF